MRNWNQYDLLVEQLGAEKVLKELAMMLPRYQINELMEDIAINYNIEIVAKDKE